MQTETRTEYRVTYHGRHCVRAENYTEAARYIAGGVVAGNDLDDYGIEERVVVVEYDEWTSLPIQQRIHTHIEELRRDEPDANAGTEFAEAHPLV